ncbi:hypothetical protein PHSC3_001624 [Chlamydiales bacterium STE3]|nr:hypothetical protein PHSC3_001624 [Chlamydiales bacterium STE3]
MSKIFKEKYMLKERGPLQEDIRSKKLFKSSNDREGLQHCGWLTKYMLLDVMHKNLI